MGLNKVISFFLKTILAKIKQMDPDVFLPLHVHVGKIILINLESLFSGTAQLYLLIEKDNIIVNPHSSYANNGHLVDLTLSGKSFDLGRFGLEYISLKTKLTSETDSALIGLLHRHHIQCFGDTALLQAWQAVLKNIDLDWTGLWASIVGDKLTFPITQIFKKTKTYVDVIAHNGMHAIKEYLLYEKNCFVSQPEIEQWIEEVMVLKNDTERLEKNVTLLKTRLEKLT